MGLFPGDVDGSNPCSKSDRRKPFFQASRWAVAVATRRIGRRSCRDARTDPAEGLLAQLRKGGGAEDSGTAKRGALGGIGDLTGGGGGIATTVGAEGRTLEGREASVFGRGGGGGK